MKTADSLDRIRQIARRAAAADPAHDWSHSERVLRNALRIARKEGGDKEVLAAAAYLHDIANLPKNHPDAKSSSERSMREAERILREERFPEAKLPLVADAILCHSFSRGLDPVTHEGRIFQDADRLDALGAIGIARTFAVGGATARPLYSAEDPFCAQGRKPDDKDNTLDHFYVKLLGLPATMKTVTGKSLAQERVARMGMFISQLSDELS
jgi:uncharacterized protein